MNDNNKLNKDRTYNNILKLINIILNNVIYSFIIFKIKYNSLLVEYYKKDEEQLINII